MKKLDIGNIESIKNNIDESIENLNLILNEQPGTLFNTRDFYKGKIDAYSQVAMMLAVYIEKQKKNENETI